MEQYRNRYLNESMENVLKLIENPNKNTKRELEWVLVRTWYEARVEGFWKGFDVGKEKEGIKNENI